MADERGATPRAVLMEFEIPVGIIPEEMQTSLEAQMGAPIGSPLRILVQVDEASGGPKEVLEAEARTPGRFRVPPLSGFGAKDVKPPEETPFVIEDATAD